MGSIRRCCPSRSLGASTSTWKRTSSTALMTSGHALLCGPPPLTTSRPPPLPRRCPNRSGRLRQLARSAGNMNDVVLPPRLSLYFGGGGKRGSKNSKVRRTPTSTKSPTCILYTIEESCFHHDDNEKLSQIWAWTSIELRVGHHDYLLRPWERSEKKRERYVYG